MRSVGQFKKRVSLASQTPGSSLARRAETSWQRETFLRTFVDSDPQVSKSQEELTWLVSGRDPGCALQN